MLGTFLSDLAFLAVAIPAFLLLITVIIVVHELGHFIAARLCGVTVSAFSLGFGKEIVAFVDRQGTRWRLAWLPLGGYVKFVDDDNIASAPTTSEEQDQDRASVPPEVLKGYYRDKPVWQRMIIAAAGPVANFLLAIVVYTGVYAAFGEPIAPVRIDVVSPGKPAERAGLKVGDIIESIDGRFVENVGDLQMIITTSVDRQLNFHIDRNGQKLDIKATPEMGEISDGLGGKASVGLIGITLITKASEVTTRSYSLPAALWRGTQKVEGIIEGSIRGIWDLLRLRQSVGQLAGPTKIAEVTGHVALAGVTPVLEWLAFLSTAIGLTNLIPIPILDGGHLVFLALEAIRGRPLHARTQEMAFRVGLALVLMLLVYTTVSHLFSPWLQG